MHEKFRERIDALEPLLQALVSMPPVTATSLPRVMPERGVYLFSENGRPLYVGRSNDIRGRIGRHSRPGATHRMAAFAFRLARETTGRIRATYRPEGSRAHLMTEEPFQRAFADAKTRIREMELRFVAAEEPVTQALLEMYVAVALDAAYNDFDTH